MQQQLQLCQKDSELRHKLLNQQSNNEEIMRGNELKQCCNRLKPKPDMQSGASDMEEEEGHMRTLVQDETP